MREREREPGISSSYSMFRAFKLKCGPPPLHTDCLLLRDKSDSFSPTSLHLSPSLSPSLSFANLQSFISFSSAYPGLGHGAPTFQISAEVSGEGEETTSLPADKCWNPFFFDPSPPSFDPNAPPFDSNCPSFDPNPPSSAGSRSSGPVDPRERPQTDGCETSDILLSSSCWPVASHHPHSSGRLQECSENNVLASKYPKFFVKKILVRTFL